LEQVQGEHRGFLLVAPIRGEVATIHKKNKTIGTIPVLYDLEVAMLAVLAFVILNRATQHSYTNNAHQRVIAMCLRNRVYESHVE
jgi:hypothetical protein